MGSKYILEDKNEAQRLENQSKNSLFSIEKELAEISLINQGKLLDAGCGSGLACKFINDVFPDIETFGCDISKDRIKYAKENVPRTNFFEADLSKLKAKHLHFDIILNRYVAHHLKLSQYKTVLNEFKEILNPNGKIIIIDAEGALVNIGTTNIKLLKMLKTITQRFPGDLFIARKIPSLLMELGFSKVNYKIQIMDFQKSDRLAEIEQYHERIESGKEFYISALGSEQVYDDFKELYFQELNHVPFFYNKFIIEAKL